jgi:hypothetical protein
VACSLYNEWVGRISYKPDWWLKVEEGAGAIVIHVGYTGASSRVDELPRAISHKRIVTKPASFEDFADEAIRTFQELENHETREWFKVDGEHWPGFLPHDPNAIMAPLRNTGARYDALQEKENGETAN